MLVISWNIDGIRAATKRGIWEFIAIAKPDILCLQEVKAFPEQVQLPELGYEAYWHSATRPGYSGILTLSKCKPQRILYGMNQPALDQEGRVLTLEFAEFFLVNIYTPNSQRGLTRHTYRTQVWDPMFLNYLKTLQQKKPVVFCGDLNVAHQEIDIANPKGNKKNAGFTIEERENFTKLLQSGWRDCYREFHPNLVGQYTWWSRRPNVREKNIGWRIDYFCASNELMPKIKAAPLYQEIRGSDHCPIGLEII